MSLHCIVLCKECGGNVCVCECDGMWAAHCTSCDNQIGHRGFYDPCALSREEAEQRWNTMNEPNAELTGSKQPEKGLQ